MKRKIVFLVLLWLAVAVCMGCIFAFSAQTATESSGTSGGVLTFLLRLLDSSFDTYSPEKQMALLEKYSFHIRKAAHFSIYTLLGFLISNALAYQNAIFDRPAKKNAVFFSFLMGVLYAVSDEIHQYFVPERSCEVRDMLIDSAGVAVGILLSLLLVSCIQKHKK